MTRDEGDRPLHALNDAYGRGFLFAFGFQGDPARTAYGIRTRAASHGVIEQYRYGREDGRICMALTDPA